LLGRRVYSAVAQQRKLLDSCSRIRCRGNAFTESLPSNGRPFWRHYSGFRVSCHSIIILSYTAIIHNHPRCLPKNNSRNKAFFCKIWGSHGGNYILGYDAVYSGRYLPRFRRDLLLPSSGYNSRTQKIKAAAASESLVTHVLNCAALCSTKSYF
jgi:hypothetical protein